MTLRWKVERNSGSYLSFLSHKLCCNYGNLNTIDFLSIGMSNAGTHRDFSSHNEINIDSNENIELEVSNTSNAQEINDSIRNVNAIHFEVFFSKLVEHFNILFERKKIA